MPKIILKTKECGCILKTISCANNTADDKDKMGSIGRPKYFIMCNKCKQYEENGNVKMHDIRLSDNVTNDFEYKEKKC